MKMIKDDAVLLAQEKYVENRAKEDSQAKAEARAKRIQRNKRKLAFSIIGGALIGAPLLYGAMLSMCILF